MPTTEQIEKDTQRLLRKMLHRLAEMNVRDMPNRRRPNSGFSFFNYKGATLRGIKREGR